MFPSPALSCIQQLMLKAFQLSAILFFNTDYVLNITSVNTAEREHESFDCRCDLSLQLSLALNTLHPLLIHSRCTLRILSALSQRVTASSLRPYQKQIQARHNVLCVVGLSNHSLLRSKCQYAVKSPKQSKPDVIKQPVLFLLSAVVWHRKPNFI